MTFTLKFLVILWKGNDLKESFQKSKGKRDNAKVSMLRSTVASVPEKKERKQASMSDEYKVNVLIHINIYLQVADSA